MERDRVSAYVHKSDDNTHPPPPHTLPNPTYSPLYAAVCLV